MSGQCLTISRLASLDIELIDNKELNTKYLKLMCDRHIQVIAVIKNVGSTMLSDIGENIGMVTFKYGLTSII